MITAKFKEIAKGAMVDIRDVTHEVEQAIDRNDYKSVSYALSKLSGCVSTAAILILAKVIFEAKEG
jgi:alpha-L-fucosidase